MREIIIDVSHWQELINWPAVHAAGVTRAIIKLTTGRHGGDPYGARNWKEAGKLGIKRGVYGWLVPNDGNVDLQARNLWQFADALGFDKAEDWFVAGDVEDKNGLTANIAGGFMSAIGQRFGMRPTLYSNLDTLRGLGRLSWRSSVDLWLADYSPPYLVPEGFPQPFLIQYSKTGRLPGIVGFVDLNKLPEAAPAIVYRVRVINAPAGLRIRSGPSITATIVGAVRNGSELAVYDESGKWLKVGEGQWIAGWYTTRIA